MARPAPIQIEGLAEFQQAVRRHADRDLPKRLGQAHKEVGRFVISRLEPRPVPAAVGQGGGATVRPSATKREVVLRVGGGHRETRAEQWGKRQVTPFQDAPPRPFIVGTARAEQAAIEDKFRDAVLAAMEPAFHSVSR